MKYFIILLIANFVFFGCEANNAGFVGQCLGVDTSSTTVTLDDPEHQNGTGTITYTIIKDQTGLRAIENNLAAHYILCRNISLNGTFAQINPDLGTDPDAFVGPEFTGTLEGNDRTISNLRIRAEDSDYVGLFGKIGTGGKVRNLKLSLANGGVTNPNMSGRHYVGALAGENEGTITNVGVTGGYVKGTGNNIGGLVGFNNAGGTIAQSHASSSVIGNNNIGGLVGDNNGGITASYVTGSVEGAVSTSIYIGGLVGYNDADGTIAQSHASSSVIGNNNIGGLIGANNGEIAQSYATGSVTGNTNIGGLVGLNSDTITASYATGSVTGNSNVGGLVGDNPFTSATITASYFDATTTGQPQLVDNQGADDYTRGTAYYTNLTDGKVYTEAGGNGTLIDQSNFSAWDPSIWTWQENGQWPLIQFQ